MKAIKIVCSILILLFSIQAWAQTDSTSNPVREMVFTHNEKSKTNTLTEGRKLTLTFKDSTKEEVKGRFSIINDSTIMIHKKTYVISEISRIKSQRLGQKITGAAIALPGAILVTIGAIITIAGVGYYAGSQGDVDAAYLAGAGLLITIVGAIPSTAGLVMTFGGKMYDVEDFWTVSLVE